MRSAESDPQPKAYEIKATLKGNHPPIRRSKQGGRP